MVLPVETVEARPLCKQHAQSTRIRYKRLRKDNDICDQDESPDLRESVRFALNPCNGQP